MNRGSVDRILLAAFFLLLTALMVGAVLSRRWLPPVASEHGKEIDGMITYLLWAAGGVFVIGHGVLAFFLLRPRKETAPPSPRLSPKTEFLWALAPVLAMTGIAEVGVLVIGMPVWSKVYGPPPEGALDVEVVGKQFEWIVRYPGRDGKYGRTLPALVVDATNPLGLDESDEAARDDLVFRGSLHLPAGRPVVVRLRSNDVLHSFSIPELRVKQDVIPGHTGRTQFLPERAGTFEIACAELCGLGHYRMRGFAYVKTPEEFERWKSKQVGWFE